jgi:small GTP-binding protein
MNEKVVMRKKVCLLGDPAVGKSSLIRKYVYNQFSEVYISTIGTEVTKKEILVDYQDDSNGLKQYEVSIAIWDIIGQKEYRSLISRFFKNANGALVVCDLSRDDTLQNLREWISSLFGAIGKVPVIFVGNKFDLIDQRSFNSDSLLEISCRYGAPWITTSAKSGDNVKHAFLKLSQLMIKDSLYFEKMNSLIDVLDAMIVDFCEVNGGLEIGMPLFKEEFSKIPGASLREPNMDVVEQLINALTKITYDNKGREIASFQSSRFNTWLKKVDT